MRMDMVFDVGARYPSNVQNDYGDGVDKRYDGIGIDFVGLTYPNNVQNDYGDGDDGYEDDIDWVLHQIKISKQCIE